MSAFNKITIDTGMRIIMAPQQDAPAVTLVVFVGTGSKYETKDINGISHFLEHLYFKGTKNRPSALAVSSILDGIGAKYNAFTSHEYTAYYAKAQPRHFDTILDVISDIYLNSLFDQKEIEKEKGVIIEELNMYEDLPTHKVWDLLHELMYGDQPAGWPIVGKREVIRRLTRDDFVKYHGRHYVAAATTVVVAGNIGEGAVAKIKEAFAPVVSGAKGDKVKILEQQTKPALLCFEKKLDQTHLIIGCRAFDAFDKRRPAADVLADVLGGGMSSRLWQVVREELGAAYYVSAGTEYFTDHGQFFARAGLDNARVTLVIQKILEQLERAGREVIGTAELQRAKDHVCGNLMLDLETSDALAMWYGIQEVIGKPVETPDEAAAEIQAVTGEEVQAAAREIFRNDRLNCALIGPTQDRAILEQTLRFS